MLICINLYSYFCDSSRPLTESYAPRHKQSNEMKESLISIIEIVVLKILSVFYRFKIVEHSKF